MDILKNSDVDVKGVRTEVRRGQRKGDFKGENLLQTKKGRDQRFKR